MYLPLKSVGPRFIHGLFYLLFALLLTSAEAQEGDVQPEKVAEASTEILEATPEKVAMAKREAGLIELLNNVTLKGSFTMTGQEEELQKEEYTIKKVRKLEDGNQWLFFTRIKYGTKNMELPLPLDVLWAGDTPVVTLDELTIPGMGTFSARVVFHDKKYAGTWSHGAVGGHLFGTISKTPVAKAE